MICRIENTELCEARLFLYFHTQNVSHLSSKIYDPPDTVFIFLSSPFSKPKEKKIPHDLPTLPRQSIYETLLDIHVYSY